MSKKSNNSDFWKSSTFKGIIAVLATLLVVVIIVLVCAKVLFVGNGSDGERKTGKIPLTQEHEFTTTTKPTKTSKTRKETTTGYNDMGTDNSLEDATYSIKTVISAVYLHPQPTSASENLCVIPVGAECKVYTNENGWLYLDYNGQKGYAYYSFFTE